MKIGHLHSWIQKDMWIPCDAIMIRHQWETWDYAKKNNLNYWSLKYGKGSSREKLRDLIYNHTNSEFLFLAKNYDLIFLSMNFDNYPSSEDFRKFIKDIAIVYSKYYPNKEIILGAGNEVFEKRGSAEKVVQTTWDTAMGILNSVNPKIEVCSWNEKIKTSAEKQAFEEVLNNQQHKSVCKYMGYQSLGTEPEIARQFTRLAQLEGYEIVDTELMTETDRLSEIKTKFENNQLLGVDKVFIGCPYISEQMDDENFKKYALSIGDFYKDKYGIIQYVQQFKDKKEEVFDIMGIQIKNEYKFGDKGDKVIDWIQDQLYHKDCLDHPIDFGNFDKKTETAVKEWQEFNNVVVTGIVTKYHISVMVEKAFSPDRAFRQLIIYASK